MNTVSLRFDRVLAASLRASVLRPVVLVLRSLLRNPLPARWRYALWRPVRLLNEGFQHNLSAEESGFVLRHELLYIRHGDLWVNALLCGLLAVHWFNPLLWLAFLRARADREAACDEQVLRGEPAAGRAAYGHNLLKMETALAPAGLCLDFVGILPAGGALRSRIQSIVLDPRMRPFTRTVVAVGIAALALFGIARAAVAPGGETVSPAEFKEHFARVGMAETVRSTRLLGQWDGKAFIRVSSMNPLTRTWSDRTITVDLDALDPTFRGEVAMAANNLPPEDAVFFEQRYQTRITGVKPIEEYDDPDTFYSEIAKQLGIPKIAYEAAAAEFGWKPDDAMLTQAKVGRTRGQWQVMIVRAASERP